MVVIKILAKEHVALWYGIAFLCSIYDEDNPLQWHHNGRDSVSNRQPHICLLNRLFRRRSKKTSKLRITGLCAGTGEFPAQMASYAENVSIWWRHHGSYVKDEPELILVNKGVPGPPFTKNGLFKIPICIGKHMPMAHKGQ